MPLSSAISLNRCEGCDCRNDTPVIDPSEPDAVNAALRGTGIGSLSDKDWPCCDEVAAPCSYVLLYECSHPYPATEEVGSGSGSAPFIERKLTGFLQGQTAFDFQWIYPTVELKKECITGCRYSWNFNLITNPTMAAVDSQGLPLFEGFPTYRLADVGPFYSPEYVKPFWRPGNNIGCLVGEAPDYRLWSLVDISASPVQLTWDFHGVPGQNDPLLQLGKSAPVYEANGAWSRWGRNTMRLTDASRLEWPSLKREVCVAAVDFPYLHNECDTFAARCTCIDTGASQVTFIITITGCSNIEGTFSVLLNRYKAGDTLPCGVSFPASYPCGVFFSGGTIGSGPESCTVEGVNWSGTSIGFLSWCDGTDYHVEVYCYNLATECWVSQGEATITLQEPTCKGMLLEFTLPPLDCCCPTDPPVENDCCPGGAPRTLYADVSSTGCPDLDGLTIPLTYDAVNDWWSSSGGNLILACPSGGVWNLSFQGFTNGCDFGTSVVTATTASCDPFALTWVGLANLSTFCCVGETVDVSIYS